MSKTITIEECYGEYPKTRTTHRVNDAELAIERAITKRYGRKAVLMEDKGLCESYPRVRFGQVFKPMKGEPNTLTSITWRVCVTVK